MPLPLIPWNKGYKVDREKYPTMGHFGNHTELSKRKMSEARLGKEPWNKGKKVPQTTGDKNREWKGDNVGYSPLHRWVSRHLGNPDTCENCGANGLSGRKIHWANKDHHYRRNLKDWMRLCVPCHAAYDRGRKEALRPPQSSLPSSD